MDQISAAAAAGLIPDPVRVRANPVDADMQLGGDLRAKIRRAAQTVTASESRHCGMVFMPGTPPYQGRAAGPGSGSVCVSPPSGAVHLRPPTKHLPSSRTAMNIGEHRSAVLESVLVPERHAGTAHAAGKDQRCVQTVCSREAPIMVCRNSFPLVSGVYSKALRRSWRSWVIAITIGLAPGTTRTAPFGGSRSWCLADRVQPGPRFRQLDSASGIPHDSPAAPAAAIAPGCHGPGWHGR